MEEKNIENTSEKVKVQIKLKDIIIMGILAALVFGIIIFGVVTLLK